MNLSKDRKNTESRLQLAWAKQVMLTGLMSGGLVSASLIGAAASWAEAGPTTLSVQTSDAVAQAVTTDSTVVAAQPSDVETQRSLQQGSAVQLQADSQAPQLPELLAQGSDVESLRQDLYIDPAIAQAGDLGISPGSSFGTPTAFGADNWNAFVGAGIVNRIRNSDKFDGSITMGFGVGSAAETVGLELSYNLISLFNNSKNDGFASDGNFNLKLHRLIDANTAIAVGWENFANYGPAAGGTPSSLYVVGTHAFDLKPNDSYNTLPLTLSVGVGGGRFRTVDDIKAGRNSLGVFASAGLRVIPEMSVITNWTGQDLNLGISATPFKGVPVAISAGLLDVTGNAGDGTRFAFSVGYGFNFSGF